MCDGDPDGSHISSLLLSFFVNHMRPAIDAGMVYVVDSPLFKALCKGKRVFGYSLADVRSKVNGNSDALITRLKGHGEANADEVKEYAMDIRKRKLLQVRLVANDVIAIGELMGNESAFRKILLGLN